MLFEESPRGLQVAHCSRAAVESGVAPGMPLAEGRTLTAAGHFERHDPAADFEALRKLAVRCQRFSPLVGIGDESSLLLDVTGCAPHFGGEPSLAKHAAAFFSRGGLVSRISMADTIGAVWGASHFGRGGVIPPGETESALRPLPVAALRLDFSIVATLAELGIRTVGELLDLPHGSLASRFGFSLAERLDQVFGRLPELIIPVKLADPVRVVSSFDSPITDRRLLELALHRMIEQLADALEDRQSGVQRLSCQIDRVAFVIGTNAPTASVPHLWELVRLHLERIALPGEVTRIELHSLMTARLVAHQQQFIRDEQVDDRELRRLLDRLASRLGEDALLRPTLVHDALPEFACRLDPLSNESDCEATPNPAGLFRPLRMHPQPVPVEVMSVVPDGPPMRFDWKAETHTISRSWGPERIESGWWRARQVKRDYYRVETTTGQRFWLFRELHEGSWYLHGAFE